MFGKKEKKVATPVPTRDVSATFQFSENDTLQTLQGVFEAARKFGVPDHAHASVYASYIAPGHVTFTWEEPLVPLSTKACGCGGYCTCAR